MVAHPCCSILITDVVATVAEPVRGVSLPQQLSLPVMLVPSPLFINYTAGDDYTQVARDFVQRYLLDSEVSNHSSTSMIGGLRQKKV